MPMYGLDYFIELYHAYQADTGMRHHEGGSSKPGAAFIGTFH